MIGVEAMLPLSFLPELVSGRGTAIRPHRHAELVSASIGGQGWKPDGGCKVGPMRIVALDQVDLPLPVPALELLLAEDSGFHAAEHLEPDEAMDGVALGETGDAIGAMLIEPADKIGGHADIERAIGLAAQNIDAWLSFHRNAQPAAKWMLKQVQHDELGDCGA